MNTEDMVDLGTPGVLLRIPEMRPVVVDEALAEQTLHGEDMGDRVVVLIALGRFADAAEAVTEARLLDPGNLRLRLLDTEVIRWNGDADRAVRRLRRILDETAGTPGEADVLQQLGADFYSMGDRHAAATRFRDAWRGRVSAGADPAKVECSRLCHELVARGAA